MAMMVFAYIAVSMLISVHASNGGGNRESYFETDNLS